MAQKTKAQQIHKNKETGDAWENLVRSEFDRTIPHNYSEQQAHGANRFDFALEDSGGDQFAIVEVKSGSWHDKAQADGFVDLAENTRAKVLVTVGDQQKFDKGVCEVIDRAEQQGRITHINVPPDQMEKFADLSKQWTDKVDAIPNRDCPELGKEFKATWEKVQSAEVKQATAATVQPHTQVSTDAASSWPSQQPGLALSQSRYQPSPTQPASSPPTALSQQPGLALSQPRNYTSPAQPASSPSTAHAQQPGLALSQPRNYTPPAQPASSPSTVQAQQPGTVLSSHQQGQPPSATPAVPAATAQPSPVSPLGVIKFK